MLEALFSNLGYANLGSKTHSKSLVNGILLRVTSHKLPQRAQRWLLGRAAVQMPWGQIDHQQLSLRLGAHYWDTSHHARCVRLRQSHERQVQLASTFWPRDVHLAL